MLGRTTRDIIGSRNIQFLSVNQDAHFSTDSKAVALERLILMNIQMGYAN